MINKQVLISTEQLIPMSLSFLQRTHAFKNDLQVLIKSNTKGSARNQWEAIARDYDYIPTARLLKQIGDQFENRYN